ncbi:hypothetical protein GCM10020366_71040 [Saccharopolyspora gregorii]|uniref:Phytoene synthase n=1 Tax=Saccharopolyspora gregorii TaxID=33914 RepID=A0ABP6S2T0_9PSEU
MLDSGAPLVGKLPMPARLAVAGYVAGGRANRPRRSPPPVRPISGRRDPRPRRTAAESVRCCCQEVPGDTSVPEAYRECERITRERARNFSYGIRLLPGPKRRALSAVYAFARRVDDIGDGELPPPRSCGCWPKAAPRCTTRARGPRTR